MQKDQLPNSTQDLETQLWHVWDMLMQLLEGNRGHYLEAKAWLLDSLGHLNAPNHERMEALGRFLRPKPQHNAVAAAYCVGADVAIGSAAAVQAREQLLLLWLEQQPTAAANIIMEQPSIVKNFFEGNKKNISMWFSHFSMDGMTSFKYGARALAHYTLAHRDEVHSRLAVASCCHVQVWQYLVWTGKHPQAPVTVATKTHYFCEVDVVRSVSALLQHCPDFWTSTAFTDSVCKGGELLQLDPSYFCKALLGVLDDGGRTAQHLSQQLQTWLQQPHTWMPACQRVLHLLTDDQLLQVVHDVGSSPQLHLLSAAPRQPPAASVQAWEGWLEAGRDMRGLVLSQGPTWRSLPHLVLTHALAVNRRHLLQLLVEDEEARGTLQQLTHISVQLHPPGAAAITLPQDSSVQEFVSSLRDPSGSASTRQLLALHTWCLYLSLCVYGHAAGVHGTDRSWLETLAQSLGGSAQPAASTTADKHSDDEGAGRQSNVKQQQYRMLTSSSSGASSDSTSDTGSDSGGSRRRKQRRKKRKRKSKGKAGRDSKSIKRRKRHRRDAGTDGHDSPPHSDDGLRDHLSGQGLQQTFPSKAQMQQLASATLQVTLPRYLWTGATGREASDAAPGYVGTVTVIDLIDILCSVSTHRLWRHSSRL